MPWPTCGKAVEEKEEKTRGSRWSPPHHQSSNHPPSQLQSPIQLIKWLLHLLRWLLHLLRLLLHLLRWVLHLLRPLQPPPQTWSAGPPPFPTHRPPFLMPLKNLNLTGWRKSLHWYARDENTKVQDNAERILCHYFVFLEWSNSVLILGRDCQKWFF